MTDLKMHIVQPQNLKGLYNEFENVDFLLSTIGRKVVCNSIRLCANVSTNAAYEDRVRFDNFTGAASFIESITTSFQNTGVVETQYHYSRSQSAKYNASIRPEDTLNSNHQVELRSPSSLIGWRQLQGTIDQQLTGQEPNDYPTETRLSSFAHKLDFILNNAVGDTLLPYTATGDIMVSIVLPRSVQALFGAPTIGNEVFYTLSNLRLMYSTVADDLTRSPQYSFNVRASLKQSIQSNLASISTKMAIVASSMYCTAIAQADENDTNVNSMENQRLRDVDFIEILWSDSFSTQYLYQLDNEAAILENYVAALTKGGVHNCSTNVLACNNGWGFGVNFGGLLDLNQNKITINLSSGVSSTLPYSVYIFFSGALSIPGGKGTTK